MDDRPPRRTWGSATEENRRPEKKPVSLVIALSTFLAVFVGGLAVVQWPHVVAFLDIGAKTSSSAGQQSTHLAAVRQTLEQKPVRLESDTRAVGQPSFQFELCSGFIRSNCVVDGDTIWYLSRKIRVADIDAPEKSEPKCDSEYQLAMRATYRLRDVLNQGTFQVQPIGDRDQDQYGRDLRVLTRNGQSLGDVLVSEGLARTWTGRREPWC